MQVTRPWAEPTVLGGFGHQHTHPWGGGPVAPWVGRGSVVPRRTVLPRGTPPGCVRSWWGGAGGTPSLHPPRCVPPQECPVRCQAYQVLYPQYRGTISKCQGSLLLNRHCCLLGLLRKKIWQQTEAEYCWLSHLSHLLGRFLGLW